MTKILYSKSLKVTCKCKNSENKIVSMEITIGTRTMPGSLDKEHILITLLSDDLSFLYQSCLGEDDFQILKKEQGLLVDFSAFPQSVIALLQRCYTEETKKKPNFFLQFEVDRRPLLDSSTCSEEAGVLDVIEVNPFKLLSHLSLKLVPRNNNDIIGHLVSCVQESLEKQEKLKEKLFSTERCLIGKLDEAHQEFSARSQKLNQLQMENEEKLKVLHTAHATEVELEKDKASKIQERMLERYDREKIELQSSYQNILLEKENQLNAMDHLNEELVDKLNKGEKQLKSDKLKFASLEENYEKYKVALKELDEKNKILQAKRHELNNNIHGLKSRFFELEQELLDKEVLVAKISASLDDFQQQKEKDVARLQKELAASVELARSKSETLRLQEKELEAMKQAYKKIAAELKEKNTLLKESEGEVKKVKEDIKKTGKELNKAKYCVGKSEVKIMRLNQQLIEKQKYASPTQPRALIMCNSNTLHLPVIIHSKPLSFIHQSPTTSDSHFSTSRHSSAHNLLKPRKSSVDSGVAFQSDVYTNIKVQSQNKKLKQPSETSKQPLKTSTNKIGVTPRKSHSVSSIKVFHNDSYPNIHPAISETNSELKKSLSSSCTGAVNAAMKYIYFICFSDTVVRKQSPLKLTKPVTNKALVASSNRPSTQTVNEASLRSRAKSQSHSSKSSKSTPS